jgi:hypothetical protein
VALKTVNASLGLLQNQNIRKDRTDLLEPDTDDYIIEQNQKVHREVLNQIMTAHPPREEWACLHPSFAPPLGQAPLAGAGIAAESSTAPDTKARRRSARSSRQSLQDIESAD